MNLSDLTQVLRERADEPVDLPPESRLAAIRDRVMARRRRRIVMAVSGLVVLLLAGVVLVPWHGRTAPPVGNRTIEGFPEYQSGTRVIAAGSGALPNRTLTVRFVPASLDLEVFTRCDIPGRQLFVRLEVNGASLSPGTTCGAGVDFAKPGEWADHGVRVGAPAEVTLTVTGGQSPRGDLLPIPDSGAFAMAVGEAVSPDEYPYPPRPSTLVSLDAVGLPATSGELRADPTDPNRPQQLSLTWPGPLDLAAGMNTPGRLRILVNDVEVLILGSWGYHPAFAHTSDASWPELGLRLEPGQPVTIRVLPERASGDWKVSLARYR